MDVGEDTTAGNGHVTEQLVKLLVIADGKLEVTGRDGLLLVISSGITGQLEDFSSQVLKNCSQVDWGTGTDTLGIVTLA